MVSCMSWWVAVEKRRWGREESNCVQYRAAEVAESSAAQHSRAKQSTALHALNCIDLH